MLDVFHRAPSYFNATRSGRQSLDVSCRDVLLPLKSPIGIGRFGFEALEAERETFSRESLILGWNRSCNVLKSEIIFAEMCFVVIEIPIGIGRVGLEAPPMVKRKRKWKCFIWNR
jgi:hypothetical protein